MRFLLILLLPIAAFAQKIKVNETDKFTGQHRVETNYVPLKEGFTTYVTVKLRSVDTTYFLSLRSSGFGVGVINDQDECIFLLQDGSKVEIWPTGGIQDYEIASSGNYCDHQYRITRGQIEQLAGGKALSVRKHYNQNYADLDIKTERMAPLCALFLKTIGN